MNLKDLFVEAANTLPEELQPYLQKTIPTLAPISLPTDEKSAAIADGTLAYNLNLILKELEGMPMLPVVLRAGQLNSVFQGILAASLEYIDKDKLDVITPERGAIYYGWYEGWQVQITGDEKPVKVMGRVNGETFAFAPGANGVYAGSYPTPIGEHQAYITAELKHDTLEALVGFSVRHWDDMPTVPEDGGEYPESELLNIRAAAGISAGNVGAMSFNTALGASIQLISQAGGDFIGQAPSWIAGPVDAVFQISIKATGAVVTKVVSFIIK